jgi:hypothetical protein
MPGHIEQEDCRVKQVQDALLADFIPAAINAVSAEGQDGVAQELTTDKCQVHSKTVTLVSCSPMKCV